MRFLQLRAQAAAVERGRRRRRASAEEHHGRRRASRVARRRRRFPARAGGDGGGVVGALPTARLRSPAALRQRRRGEGRGDSAPDMQRDRLRHRRRRWSDAGDGPDGYVEAAGVEGVARGAARGASRGVRREVPARGDPGARSVAEATEEPPGSRRGFFPVRAQRLRRAEDHADGGVLGRVRRAAGGRRERPEGVFSQGQRQAVPRSEALPRG
mmetsp:Transcript_11724/g.50548  ORF Transcript_11724/g.50548 Transcript_11724/m.50548 type:complete len:213 (-) Transcript_11724:37-675(-)